MNLNFLVSDYFATGEGSTFCVMITEDDKEEAMQCFMDDFGGYFAQCAEFLEQEEFLERYAHLVPPALVNILTGDSPGNIDFTQQFHVNFS